MRQGSSSYQHIWGRLTQHLFKASQYRLLTQVSLKSRRQFLMDSGCFHVQQRAFINAPILQCKFVW